MYFKHSQNVESAGRTAEIWILRHGTKGAATLYELTVLLRTFARRCTARSSVCLAPVIMLGRSAAAQACAGRAGGDAVRCALPWADGRAREESAPGHRGSTDGRPCE